ncbi:MAG: hypothetical protein HYZ26_11195 [Chloroflexi bacterium]|nr:hypothetical protein [Chloroflexota bacterium]
MSNTIKTHVTRLLLDPQARRVAQFVLLLALVAASLMLTGTAYADGPSPGPVGG